MKRKSSFKIRKISIIAVLTVALSVCLACFFACQIKIPCKHVFDNGVITINATCTEKGEKTLTCTKCGVTERQEISALGHNWEKTSSTATCLVDGTDFYTCVNCKGTMQKDVKATGHNWEKTSSTVSTATCLVDRTDFYTCVNCKDTKQEHIVAKGHQYDNGDFAFAEGENNLKQGKGTWKYSCQNCDEFYTEDGTMNRKGNNLYGYLQFASEDYGEEKQRLYRELYTACEEFLDCNEDIDLSGVEKTYFPIGTFTIWEPAKNIRLGDDLTQAKELAISVWAIIRTDCPTYYWISSAGVTSTTADNKKASLKLMVDNEYASYEERHSADIAIEQETNNFLAMIDDNMTELEKVKVTHDYLCERMNYAHDSSGSPESKLWAHSIDGWARYGNGVCECYSQTFLYLCNHIGIKNIPVTGYATNDARAQDPNYSGTELHAWNIVKINGVWYNFDLTWDGQWSTYTSYEYFALSGDTFKSKNHTARTPQGKKNNYLYPLPETATVNSCLATVYKGNVKLGLYLTLDEALNVMTDVNGDYTLELFDYRTNGNHNSVVVPVLTKTPTVKSLTIDGVYTDYYSTGTGSVVSPYNLIMFADNLKLNCELTLKNVQVNKSGNGTTLNFNGHKVTLDGVVAVYFDSFINGSKSNFIDAPTIKKSFILKSNNTYW